MSAGAPAPLVLHVIHHLVTGGLENGLVNLINHMPPERFRHAIVCIEDFSPEFRERIRREGVEVLPLYRSRIGVWRLRRALFDICRRLRPAIVHTRNQSGLDALLPARLAGVRATVHGEHGWDVDNLTGDKWKPIVRRRLHAPLISRYITVSKDLQRFLCTRVGIAQERITQIYNGVDTARYAPLPTPASALAPAGFLPADAFVFGTVGRLQPVKDQATLINAFARLVQGDPLLKAKSRLIIVGDGSLATPLRAQASAAGVAEQCWFAGNQADVPALLRLMHVFVLPSLNEGISNTILEAMASGLPLLVTRVGGNVELVEENRAGRFFAPGDDAALTELMAQYAYAPALAREHGKYARQAASERFSLQAMVANYQAVYASLAR